MIPWWVYVLAGALLVGGPVVLVLLFAGAKKLNGPDTDQRDPYRLAGRDSDAPAVHLTCAGCNTVRGNPHLPGCPDDDLAVARTAGVVPDVEPADSGLAGEVEGWLRDRTPLPAPIVPGVDGPVRHGDPKPDRPEGMCRYVRGGEGGS